MKPFDLLLLSFALGLSIFTVRTLTTDGAADASTTRPEWPSAFRSIVLHHSVPHENVETPGRRPGKLAYHFIIDSGRGNEDGKIETSYRWRDRIPAPHTANVALNRESVAVCLVGDMNEHPPTQKQVLSLLNLMERLCREGNIPPTRIFSHGETDSKTTCPGKDLPMDQLRGAVAARLAAVREAPKRTTPPRRASTEPSP